MQLSNKRWNQGDLDLNSFPMQRERATHQVRIDMPVERLFALACLTGQPGWLAAGSVCLIYSEGGKDEVRAIWSDSDTGVALLQRSEQPTFWTTTAIRPDTHCYQAVLANPELAVGTLDVEMVADGEGTIVRFALSYTVLSEAGSALFDEGMVGRLAQQLKRFARTLRAVASTGATPRVVVAPQQELRRSVEHVAEMSGDIDECFALACPVAELKWIDNWRFDLIYSDSGLNETGCVFLEPFTGMSVLRSRSAINTWYCTRYDTESHEFEAVWLTRDLTLAHWEFTMAELGDGRVRAHWSLCYTSLGRAGRRLVGETNFDQRMQAALGFLSLTFQTYVESGSPYRIPTSRKLQVVASLIGASFGRHFRSRNGRRRTSQASPA